MCEGYACLMLWVCLILCVCFVGSEMKSPTTRVRMHCSFYCMPRGGYFLISLTHGFSFPRNHLFFFSSYYFSPQDLLSLSIVSVGNLGSAVQVSNAFTGTTTTGTISGATTTGGATSATTLTLPTALPTLLMRHNDTIPVFNDFFGTPGISAGDAAYVICAMDTVRVRDR